MQRGDAEIRRKTEKRGNAQSSQRREEHKGRDFNGFFFAIFESLWALRQPYSGDQTTLAIGAGHRLLSVSNQFHESAWGGYYSVPMKSRIRFAGGWLVASVSALMVGALSCIPEHAQQPPKPVAAMNVPVTTSPPSPEVNATATKPSTAPSTRRAFALRSPELGADGRVTFR